MNADEYNRRQLEQGGISYGDVSALVSAYQEFTGILVDGKFGPNTRAALIVGRTPKLELPPLDDLDAGAYLMLKTLELNVAEFGEGETDGNNRGARIEFYRMTDGTGIGVGGSGPWCATVQSSSLKRAADMGALELPCRTSRNAKRLGDQVGKAGRFLDVPEVGCFVVWNRGQNPAQGHIGQALSYDPRTDTLLTVEGNKTRPGESRAFVGEFEYTDGSWRDELYCLSTLALPIR